MLRISLKRLQGFRFFSSGPELTELTFNSKGHAILSLKRTPVNALNLGLITSITKTLEKVDERRCPGLILTSVSIVSLFSPGSSGSTISVDE